MKFGEKIKSLRMASSLSLRELAKKIDVSPSYLQRIELLRDKPPSGEVIGRLAAILGVNPAELFILAENRLPQIIYDAVCQNKVSMEKVPELLGILKERNLNRQSWDRVIRSIKMLL